MGREIGAPRGILVDYYDIEEGLLWLEPQRSFIDVVGRAAWGISMGLSRHAFTISGGAGVAFAGWR
jgi:hypothetical protein